MGAVCRHCKFRAACSGRNVKRGLCWKCAQDPAIRVLYPSTSKYANKQFLNFYGSAPLPHDPTDAPPGSLAKMAVMQQRLERGELLCHPDDEKEVVLELLDPFPSTQGLTWEDTLVPLANILQERGDGMQAKSAADRCHCVCGGVPWDGFTSCIADQIDND